MENPENFVSTRTYNPFAPEAVEESSTEAARQMPQPEIAEMKVAVDRPVFKEREEDIEKLAELAPLFDDLMSSELDPIARFQKKTKAIRDFKRYLGEHDVTEEILAECRLAFLLSSSTPRPEQIITCFDVFNNAIERFIRSDGEVPKE